MSPGCLCAAAHSTIASFAAAGISGFSYFCAALVAPFLPSTILADLSGGKRPLAGSNAGIASTLIRGKPQTRACLTPLHTPHETLGLVWVLVLVTSRSRSSGTHPSESG